MSVLEINRPATRLQLKRLQERLVQEHEAPPPRRNQKRRRTDQQDSEGGDDGFERPIIKKLRSRTITLPLTNEVTNPKKRRREDKEEPIVVIPPDQQGSMVSRHEDAYMSILRDLFDGALSPPPPFLPSPPTTPLPLVKPEVEGTKDSEERIPDIGMIEHADVETVESALIIPITILDADPILVPSPTAAAQPTPSVEDKSTLDLQIESSQEGEKQQDSVSALPRNPSPLSPPFSLPSPSLPTETSTSEYTATDRDTSPPPDTKAVELAQPSLPLNSSTETDAVSLPCHTTCQDAPLIHSATDALADPSLIPILVASSSKLNHDEQESNGPLLHGNESPLPIAHHVETERKLIKKVVRFVSPLSNIVPSAQAKIFEPKKPTKKRSSTSTYPPTSGTNFRRSAVKRSSTLPAYKNVKLIATSAKTKKDAMRKRRISPLDVSRSSDPEIHIDEYIPTLTPEEHNRQPVLTVTAMTRTYETRQASRCRISNSDIAVSNIFQGGAGVKGHLEIHKAARLMCSLSHGAFSAFTSGSDLDIGRFSELFAWGLDDMIKRYKRASVMCINNIINKDPVTP